MYKNWCCRSGRSGNASVILFLHTFEPECILGSSKPAYPWPSGVKSQKSEGFDSESDLDKMFGSNQLGKLRSCVRL